ncbi:carboxymuconolactone decarboxylase family protein [Marinicrinis lubricantis]|uniref:Carboxymuconolactone decarboxylase family protein n=1 Tax=Marinicrinis lubricantis TaxID=2086470 RepID=A0ABW1ITX8_9BACL
MDKHMADEKVMAYRIGVGHMKDQLPDLVEAYHHFTGRCFQEGELSLKDKHLIALGISLTSNNEVCTFNHVREALSSGATPKQVLETVAVAAALGGGHAMSQGVTRVQQALDQSGSIH